MIQNFRKCGIFHNLFGLIKSKSHQGDKTREARKEILLHERAKLTAQMQSIQQALEKLDKKIAMYENGKECTPR